MRLTHVALDTSPTTPGCVRLSGEIKFEKSGEQALYWLEVPEQYAAWLSDSGNSWLALLLPLAVSVREPLRLCRPVDRGLFENASKIMRIWKRWYPYTKVIPIQADVMDAPVSAEARRTVAFFTGGVDSFFTVLSHAARIHGTLSAHIDDLIFVNGFDLPLSSVAEFEQTRILLQRAADELGKTLIILVSNLDEAGYRKKAPWGLLSHGAALASTVLALEKRYCKVLLASSWARNNLTAWGSHPDTDPLFSTSQLQMAHDGVAFNRSEKVAFIAESPIAMHTLRVCLDTRNGKNCGRCSKCERTMLELEMCNALERCTTFDVAFSGEVDYRKMTFFALRDLIEFARRVGRSDVVESVEREFRRRRYAEFFTRLNKRLNNRHFWRWLKTQVHYLNKTIRSTGQ